jgi:hypothetical protein
VSNQSSHWKYLSTRHPSSRHSRFPAREHNAVAWPVHAWREVAMRCSNAPRMHLSIRSNRVGPPYSCDIRVARHRCRVTPSDMYGMNQAYSAGGSDPSAQVPNHLVSAPAAVSSLLGR